MAGERCADFRPRRALFAACEPIRMLYLPLYVAGFQFRYNNRYSPDIFGTAIKGC